jgi:uncharacterized protein (DUF1697 family)
MSSSSVPDELSLKTIHLALLRGINVGGKNKIPMKELVKIFVECGCDQVRTYIQSGNVIFQAAAERLPQIPGEVTAQIANRFGYQIPVILRTREQLERIIRNNPFLASGIGPEALHIMFLADKPTAIQVAALDPNRSPPDAFNVRGRDIYLHFPLGSADSKLTNAYFDSKLGTASTARNWRTVITLFELMGK